MTAAQMTLEPVAMSGLKERLRNTWMAGDYDHFSRYMEMGARDFYSRMGLLAGMRLLDVACGSGQIALMAAREGVRATGVDIAENLIGKARARATAMGLPARFECGDAEELPLADGSFDVVASLVGAMFAPRPERVAREMARVCVPGGKVVMGNWTASGFVGKMFRVISRFIAPAGMPSPLLWGDEEVVGERFDGMVAHLEMKRRNYVFDYPFGPAGVVELFRKYYGPAQRAFESLDEAGQEELRRALEALWTEHNRANGEVTVVEAEYLEVMAWTA